MHLPLCSYASSQWLPHVVHSSKKAFTDLTKFTYILNTPCRHDCYGSTTVPLPDSCGFHGDEGWCYVPKGSMHGPTPRQHYSILCCRGHWLACMSKCLWSNLSLYTYIKFSPIKITALLLQALGLGTQLVIINSNINILGKPFPLFCMISPPWRHPSYQLWGRSTKPAPTVSG